MLKTCAQISHRRGFMKDYSSFLKDLTDLIACESVKGEPLPAMPFGKGVHDALECFLSVARRMGFKTVNYDGYMGEVVFGNTETADPIKDSYGIIGHLDVVPTGGGWATNPFVLTKKGGYYYARGIADDKAPLLLCLYALKELKDRGIIPKKTIRLFCGCDEESGWRDAAYFTQKNAFPEYGFSPDGNFPVIYSEKAMSIIKFYLPPLKRFRNLKGGTVVNAVCGYATAVADDDAIDKNLLTKYGLTLKDGNVIESIGVSCHGSQPEKGKNALDPLFKYFYDMGEDVGAVVGNVFGDGKCLRKITNEQGSVTLSADIAEETPDGIVLTCDCRTPSPVGLKDITPVLDAFGLKYTATEKHPPFIVEKDDPFVQKLLSAYNTVTGENAVAAVESGCTFARVFKKGCAFGAAFPNENSSIHEANEHLSENSLLKTYEIYLTAIYDLIK